VRLRDLAAAENLGTLERLADYVRANPVDVIYIALPMASQPRILRLLEDLRDTTTSIYFVPDIFVSDLIQARVDFIGELPVVAVCETPFYGFNGLVKRVSDFVLAGTILLGISPLMAAIAIGVKLSSPGPVLFKQRRYGVDGRKIVVYKFRSMTVAEDGDVVRQATRNDSRITKFGAFLRRTSLDELPQFINVLQGRMSVVGPRPHAVAHNELYRKLIRGYMIRHKVRPGITGLAQVNGMRGETDTVDKMKLRIEYDLAYLRNWSLALDLKIILQTVAVVLRGQNAY
jgi:putative colanic acid biosynthesis UDP-glucose lipid carrier transferase